MPFIQADGHRLEYDWIGPEPAQAPTLVFLHEGLGSVAMWKGVPAALAAATGCGALVYSRCGYGRSTRVLQPRPVAFMHREAGIVLPAVLRALGVRAPILVGHSDGGSIALIYAGSRSAQAPAPTALVLEAPHVFVEAITTASIAQLGEQFRHSGLRSKLARYHDDVDGAFWGWRQVWLSSAFARWNIESLLADVACPVLAIQGQDDQYGSSKQIDAIAAQVAGPVEVHLLSDCGHAPHHQAPEPTLGLITDFVNRIVAGCR